MATTFSSVLCTIVYVPGCWLCSTIGGLPGVAAISDYSHHYYRNSYVASWFFCSVLLRPESKEFERVSMVVLIGKVEQNVIYIEYLIGNAQERRLGEWM